MFLVRAKWSSLSRSHGASGAPSWEPQDPPGGPQPSPALAASPVLGDMADSLLSQRAAGGAGGSPGLPSPGEFPSASRTGCPSWPLPSPEANAGWAVGVLPLKGRQSRMLICNVEKSSQDKEHHSISRTGGRRKNLRPWPPQPSRAFPGAARPSYQPVGPSPRHS